MKNGISLTSLLILSYQARIAWQAREDTSVVAADLCVRVEKSLHSIRSRARDADFISIWSVVISAKK